MSDSSDKGERISKVMAHAGLCSRRDAERWIAEGRVKVDGKVLTTPAFVVTGANKIVVDGKPLPVKDEPRLWRYYKPNGLLVSHNDPQGRETVFDKLPKELGRVISVGRLDLTSEGLLLLTNNGDLARKLEHPDTGWTRRYRVRVHGTVKEDDLAKLKKGVTIDEIRYGSIRAKLEREQTSANAWLSVAIQEGKNREIRKIMEHIGLTVTRLIRVGYGPFQLGNLEEGTVEPVRRKVLKDQLGPVLKAIGVELKK